MLVKQLKLRNDRGKEQKIEGKKYICFICNRNFVSKKRTMLEEFMKGKSYGCHICHENLSRKHSEKRKPITVDPDCDKYIFWTQKTSYKSY